jgi:hypothetical protein
VIIRAHQVSGAPAVLAGGTRFESWANLVRAPIGWLHSRGWDEAAGIGSLGDPAAQLLALNGAGGDPATESLGELLRGINLTMPGESFQARELMPLIAGGECTRDEGLSLIRSGVEGLVPNLRDLSSKKLTWVLGDKRDAIVGGLVLRALTMKTGETQRYLVARA